MPPTSLLLLSLLLFYTLSTLLCLSLSILLSLSLLLFYTLSILLYATKKDFFFQSQFCATQKDFSFRSQFCANKKDLSKKWDFWNIEIWNSNSLFSDFVFLFEQDIFTLIQKLATNLVDPVRAIKF